MPEYHWNHWIDPIVFPYILPVTQIALTGVTRLCVFVVIPLIVVSISILLLLSSSPMQTQKNIGHAWDIISVMWHRLCNKL